MAPGFKPANKTAVGSQIREKAFCSVHNKIAKDTSSARKYHANKCFGIRRPSHTTKKENLNSRGKAGENFL
jgi:hypothetical protein